MTDDDFLQQYLTSRDVGCPLCQYNLRDLKSDRCPECGQRIELALRLAEPRQRAWIAGIVGLSATVGFNALMLLVMFIQIGLKGRGGGDALEWLAMFGTGGIVAAAALLLWLRLRKSIQTAGALKRTLLVIGCWALAPLDIAILMAID